MKKKDKKTISVIYDDKFIISLIIYAFGFAFLSTTASYVTLSEFLEFDVLMSDYMMLVLPVILVLFITYTFGSLVFIGLFKKHDK